ncbi:uncharacterized mitochondrial protein AtMg00810-like [Telopea speciosissima]|uniref:uncharacterized mitochondrial protein AtMg00810-like n=1 Tax=Telopea speciosissima TaxID=54955 RepID=UPI001CC42E1C|nr:uncharacterized mitochondrial protein AtMg00810-like [Telopea speciosissima]
MAGVKPLSTPLSSTKHLSKTSGTLLADPTEYQSIVGALQYAILTRPNIIYAVNKACQFLAQPTDLHWQGVKCILQYLKGTILHRLQIYDQSSWALSAFFDADWASCPDDRKSTSGYLVYLGRNLVSWQSRKQHIVACLSIESEYRALALATIELTWLQSLLGELGIPISSPPVIGLQLMAARGFEAHSHDLKIFVDSASTLHGDDTSARSRVNGPDLGLEVMEKKI